MPAHLSAVLTAIWLALSISSALVVIFNMSLCRHHHPISITSVGWPSTTSYRAPVGMVLYHALGRATPGIEKSEAPMLQVGLFGATQRGTGCALGDFFVCSPHLLSLISLGSPSRFSRSRQREGVDCTTESSQRCRPTRYRCSRTSSACLAS